MTDPRDNKCWQQMADEMRRALSLHPMADAEAAAQYDEATDDPLSDDELDEAVRIAASGVPREKSYEERVVPDAGAPIDQEVGEVLGMFRNEGEKDEEVEEEIRRQREEGLSEDEEDGNLDGQEPEKS